MKILIFTFCLLLIYGCSTGENVNVSNQSVAPAKSTPVPSATTIAQNPPVNAAASPTATASSKEDNKAVYAQIKAKAQKEYPDDYVMQNSVYEQQVEAYNFMKIVPASQIKSKAEKEYPDDYVMQKFVYEQQTEAKREMDKKP